MCTGSPTIINEHDVTSESVVIRKKKYECTDREAGIFLACLP